MGHFDVEYLLLQIPFLIKYMAITLFISIISMIISLVLSIIIVIINKHEIKIISPICRFYVSFFRGTPVIIQLFLLYYGLPQIFPVFQELTGLIASIIGLSLNMSAYMMESIRGLVDSMDKG